MPTKLRFYYGSGSPVDRPDAEKHMHRRRRRNRRALYVVVVATAATATAFTLGGCFLTTPLDGFSGPTSDSSAGQDGGIANTDASVTDVVGLLETSSLDGSNNDGAPAPFRCAMLVPAPSFCTDFDNGTLVSIIGSPTTMVGGVVSLDDTVFHSPLRSLRATSPPLASGSGTGRASVERKFTFEPTTSIAIAFDIRIDSLDKSASNHMHVAMGGYVLTLFLGATARLREGVPGDSGLDYTSTDRTAPALGKWVHLTLAIQMANNASTATLAYDGVAESALPIVIDRYRAASWTVDIGLNFVGAPDLGRDVHIDNLVIDAK